MISATHFLRIVGLFLLATRRAGVEARFATPPQRGQRGSDPRMGGPQAFARQPITNNAQMSTATSVVDPTTGFVNPETRHSTRWDQCSVLIVS